MKYFLIGFAIWFMLGWFPQFVKAWLLEIRYKLEKRKASRDDKWIYEL